MAPAPEAPVWTGARSALGSRRRRSREGGAGRLLGALLGGLVGRCRLRTSVMRVTGTGTEAEPPHPVPGSPFCTWPLVPGPSHSGLSGRAAV